MNYISKTLNYLKKNGLSNTVVKVFEARSYRRAAEIYMQENYVTEEELNFQRENQPLRGAKFSIVVPLYNSNESYLRQTIDSVVGQTYENWELILVDGSSLSYKTGENTAMEYVFADSRVKYRRLGANLGISGNTNQGVKAATGDYIVFLDHDDILLPDALYRAGLAALEWDADLIYSDEYNFSGNINNVINVTLKPDFGEYTLRGINFIGHMCAVKKELFLKVGELRDEYNGSQDYDLVLRLADNTDKIVHLPYVLYGWRIHEGSVASGIEAKSYCLDSAKAAIKDHLAKRDITADIFDIPGAESAYRLKYADPELSITLVVCFEGSERQYLSYMKKVFESIGEKEVEIITVGGYNSFDDVLNIDYDGEYRFTKMANIGVGASTGDLIMFLDYRIIPQNGFLEELAPYAAFSDVGCVGGQLINRFGRVKAMGYKLDENDILSPWLKGSSKNGVGYLRGLKIAYNVSCLMGGFMMVRSKNFISVGGFNERLGVIAGGCDLCLRLFNRGNNVVTPYAKGVLTSAIDEDFYDFYTENGSDRDFDDRFLRMP